MKIKQMIRAMYRAKAVYDLRKTPFFVTVLIAVFLGILQMTPFTLRFFGIQPYRFDTQIWKLNNEAQEQLLQNLPEDCYILDLTLACEIIDGFIVGEGVTIHFNDVDVDMINGIIFMEHYFVFVAELQAYILSYRTLEGLNFGYLQSLDNGYEILFGRVAKALRGILIIPFVLNVYQTGILTFFIYIFGSYDAFNVIKIWTYTFFNI